MDYYGILELDYDDRFTITIDDIKKQYKNLARKYHPDKNRNSSDKFVQIKMAYDTLHDPVKKRIYDGFSYDGFSDEPFQLNQWSYKLLTKLARFVSPPITWKKDIILNVPIKNCRDEIMINYKRHIYSIEGIAICFNQISEEIRITIPKDFNFKEEVFTVENMGNYIIEDKKLVCGDLDLDFQFV